MNSAYWDTVAENYEREVLSVFDNDTEGLVCARIEGVGTMNRTGTAADLGCGVGKFVPLLSKTFAHVEACDGSERGLEATRKLCVDRANVQFRKLDLTCDLLQFEPVDFVLCVNVLIMPSLDERKRAWRTVTNQVAQGGTLLLVVPSLESVHFGHFQTLEKYLHEGDSCAEAMRKNVPNNVVAADLHQGVHQLDGLPTKHYLREELEQLLPDHEFDVTELIKLNYRTTGPDRKASQCSWDWLVMARRR